MNRSNSPEAGFIDPSGDNAEAVQNLAKDVVDQLLGQLTGTQDRSPLPDDSTIPEVSIIRGGASGLKERPERSGESE